MTDITNVSRLKTFEVLFQKYCNIKKSNLERLIYSSKLRADPLTGSTNLSRLETFGFLFQKDCNSSKDIQSRSSFLKMN